MLAEGQIKAVQKSYDSNNSEAKMVFGIMANIF